MTGITRLPNGVSIIARKISYGYGETSVNDSEETGSYYLIDPGGTLAEEIGTYQNDGHHCQQREEFDTFYQFHDRGICKMKCVLYLLAAV